MKSFKIFLEEFSRKLQRKTIHFFIRRRWKIVSTSKDKIIIKRPMREGLDLINDIRRIMKGSGYKEDKTWNFDKKETIADFKKDTDILRIRIFDYNKIEIKTR